MWLRALILWLLPSLALAGTANLTWTAPTQTTGGQPLSGANALTGYRLYERCGSGAQSLVASPSANSLSATRTTPDGVTCGWQLSAVNAQGESVRTAEVTRLMEPGAPTNLVVTWAPTQGQGPPSMAAVLTGTPTAVVWASGSNPAGQSITIPSDATAVYMFWQYYLGSSGHGLASVTLAGDAPDQTFEVATAAGDQAATGVAVWYNPPTGSQTLDPAWDSIPSEGPTTIVAYVKDGDTTAWRDADAANETGGTACSVTLTTESGDLVLKFDSKDGAAPANTSGWTSAQTTTNGGDGSRLAYISASGSTQAAPSEDEAYSSIVAVSIPAGAGGSASLPPQHQNVRVAVARAAFH